MNVLILLRKWGIQVRFFFFNIPGFLSYSFWKHISFLSGYGFLITQQVILIAILILGIEVKLVLDSIRHK